LNSLLDGGLYGEQRGREIGGQTKGNPDSNTALSVGVLIDEIRHPPSAQPVKQGTQNCGHCEWPATHPAAGSHHIPHGAMWRQHGGKVLLQHQACTIVEFTAVQRIGPACRLTNPPLTIWKDPSNQQGFFDGA
jgi:hypothetical protein